MSSNLSSVPWNELIRKLRKLGFIGPIAGGKHPKMIREKDQKTIIIPNKHSKEITVTRLSDFLKQWGISREEWLSC
jgi:predicted RNA binding protein YcfA (HicA-like mRNA interferase family)